MTGDPVSAGSRTGLSEQRAQVGVVPVEHRASVSADEAEYGRLVGEVVPGPWDEHLQDSRRTIRPGRVRHESLAAALVGVPDCDRPVGLQARDRDQLAAAIRQLGDMVKLLTRASPDRKARIYAGFGIRLTYHQAKKQAQVSQAPPRCYLGQRFVSEGGLEPPCPNRALAPQASASAYSATRTRLNRATPSPAATR
jgi:hypothetical protein